jgi:hypothetical protein
MATATGGCRKWLLFGCLGCLALVVQLIMISSIVFGVAWYRAKNEEVEKRQLSPTLPFRDIDRWHDDAARIPGNLDAIPPAGRVILDLRHSTFFIRPAARGEPLRIEAEFDTQSYGLTESFEEATDESGWTYEVSFERTAGSYFLTTLKELVSGSRPRVKVYLPLDIPFDLELQIVQGGAEVELGGLWLDTIDIDFLQGGGAVEISKPLVVPVDYLGVDFTQGGGAIEGIAYASPRRLDVGFNMGGGFVDLHGTWLRDSEINIDQNMGGATVRLPRDVIIRGLDRPGMRPPPETEIPPPVLTIATSSSFGNLEFIH